MKVTYKWDVETTDDHGDVQDHNHFDTAREMVAWFKRGTSGPDTTEDMVLVRDDDYGRSWAYVKDKKLPESFQDAHLVPVGKVPMNYRREFIKAWIEEIGI